MSVNFDGPHEMIVQARRNMPDDTWDYVCGGAESETTLRRNRMALDCIAFRPLILRDVREVDPSATFLGHKIRLPILLAPLGRVQTFCENGALDVDTAAEEFGTINFLSTVTEPGPEEVIANSPHPKVFQIYMRGDNDWLKELVDQVIKLKFFAVALTVDLAYYGNRERINPMQLAITRQRPARWQAGMTWDTVKMIQDRLGGIPFILKGIMTAEDAALAVEHGVQCIYISNHGGRQLDHVLGNIQMLPEIIKAADGKADVIIDGGFTRGTDIIKAMAMGARAVGIGKLQAWALGAGGAPALVKCLEMLEFEMTHAMGLLGVNSLDQLGPQNLTEAMPVRHAHEMSGFAHLPEGRIL